MKLTIIKQYHRATKPRVITVNEKNILNYRK
jgi:hypothetical protein